MGGKKQIKSTHSPLEDRQGACSKVHGSDLLWLQHG